MSELARGNMGVAVPTDDRRDEIGNVTKAMARLRDQLASAERAKTEQIMLIVDSIGAGSSRLAEGDLVARSDTELTGPFGKLKIDFNGGATALQTTFAKVAEAASGINCGASDIRQASNNLSQRTEQQAGR